MNRREFLLTAAIAGPIAIACMPQYQAPKDKARQLKVGEVFFDRFGEPYQKLADGWYTKQKCPILKGDADVIRVRDGRLSWMGPDVEVRQCRG